MKKSRIRDPDKHPGSATLLFTLCVLGFGERASYSQVGEWAGGSRGAARAVGSAMKQNPVALIVPCHRSACHLKLNFLGLEKSKAKVLYIVLRCGILCLLL
jgi:O-6-methylguanine DNA methyltransferase